MKDGYESIEAMGIGQKTVQCVYFMNNLTCVTLTKLYVP